MEAQRAQRREAGRVLSGRDEASPFQMVQQHVRMGMHRRVERRIGCDRYDGHAKRLQCLPDLYRLFRNRTEADGPAGQVGLGNELQEKPPPLLVKISGIYR